MSSTKTYLITKVNADGSAVIQPANDSPIWEAVHPITKEVTSIDAKEGHVIEVRLIGVAEPAMPEPDHV